MHGSSRALGLSVLAACLPPMPEERPLGNTVVATLNPPLSTPPYPEPPPECTPPDGESTVPYPELTCSREPDFADWPGGRSLRLDTSALVTGAPLTLTVTGAAPGDTVAFYRGDVCRLDCPPAKDGACFQGVGAIALGEGTADAAGTASLEVTPDASWEARWLVLQATVAARGAISQAWIDAVAGTVVEPVTPEWNAQLSPLTLRGQSGPGSWWFPIAAGRSVRLTYAYQDGDNESTFVAVSDGELFRWGAPEPAPVTWFAGPSSWQLNAQWQKKFGFENSYQLDVETVPLEVGVAWYPDTDGDGAGDPDGVVVVSAAPVPDASPDGRDCDDTDPDIGPAGAETCDDGIDQDCDGWDRSCAGSLGTLTGAGTRVLGLPQSHSGDRPAVAALGPAGEPLLALGGFPSALFRLSRSDALSPTYTMGEFAGNVVAAGDVTGDGIADLLTADSSELSVFAGPLVGDVERADRAVGCTGSFGWGQVLVGDVTGDDLADLVSSAWPYGGSVSWLEGPVGRADGAESGALDADAVAMGLGDADGDGLDDLWTTEVCLYLAPLPPFGATPSGCLRPGSGELLGVARPATGDLDADGHGDFVVGTGETAFLLLGPLAGEGQIATGAWGTVELTTELWHWELAVAPDRDGDDRAEVVLAEIGEAWMTPARGGVSTRSHGVSFGLADPNSWVAAPVLGGDFDGDGSGDVFVGDPSRSFGDVAYGGGGTILWGVAP